MIPFTAEVAYCFQCVACAANHSQRFQMFKYGEMPRPSLPEGWQEIGYKLYCPRHTLRVLVDAPANVA